MNTADLKELSLHFRFGDNWKSFSRLLTDERIGSAVSSLRELLQQDISGKSFLDIGCGSGLSALAASKLGADPILATDLDPVSVETTKEVLSSKSPSAQFDVRTISVFDLDRETLGSFDIVYSWGVLHHTGSMWEAIDKACQFVSSGGIFVLAIYLKTPLCGFWRAEKKFYTGAPRLVQDVLAWSFLGVIELIGMAGQLRRGQFGRSRKLAQEYMVTRGMDRMHDIRDWLGGYPYESASPAEIDEFLTKRGFRFERGQRLVAGNGLTGSGCAEYIYRRAG